MRKTVTALFCDLVGSTAFGEKVDPEAARESMNRYFAMARTAIEDNGGTVAKFIGDGVMAMWGVPEVAEDDAERAVRAGLALQDAFSGIRDFIQDRHGVSVGLRVGINTGEVVISDADDDVVGDALNTAARLEAACTPGHVLVGEPTWRLSRGAVEYREHGVIQAKGKEEPVAAYEVVDLLAVEDPHTETPFVGRDGELRRLQVVMDEAILERSARLVTVIGAPGVGKTRLAREMRAAVEGGTRAFELRCEREGMATFAPVADLLRAAAGITDSHSVDEMQERLHALVEPLDDADRVAGLLAGFVGAAPMQSTEELFLAVRRLFEVLGATQPVVLVVDDIQWAEPLFLDLLEHLAEWVRDVPLMVVCLARPEIRDVRPPITEVGRRVSAVVALEGLDTAATHELAARLVGADALPADLLAKIPDSTQGNPLFVRELMRMLVDDGVIAERDGAWEMVIDVDAVEVPPTVNTLLASRVERLAVDERQALEFASVVGSDFPLGAVAAAAGAPAGLDATFERLRRKELIEPTGTYWGDEPVFRFHHVLIRDAAYRRLLKGNRADLHVTIGDWTERSAANLVGEHEVTIAHHFEQAHQLRLQLGIDDDETEGLGVRAAALLRTAAERALEREDLAAAGPLAARALACVSDDAEGLAELLLTACESLLGTGNVAEGTAAVDRLDAVADDDGRLRAWVDCFRAEITIYTDPGGLQGVIESAGEAAEALAQLDDQAGVAKARLQRAAALVRLGRVGDCEAELDAALTAARAADDRRRVTAVLGSAPIAALWGPSPVPRAGGRCLDVVRLLRITTGSPAVEATSIRCQAVLESLRGRHDTARSMLDNARSTLEEIGHDHGLMETSYFAGLVELLADEPEAAEPHLRRAHDGLGRLGIGADAGQAAAYLARSLLLQDRLDEAEDYALQSDALAGQNPQTAIVSRSVQAEILAARGEFDEATTLAAEAVHLAANTDILVDHANAVAAQARVRAAAGDATGAAQAAAAAAALYEEKGATVDVGVVAASTQTAAPTPAGEAEPAATSDDLEPTGDWARRKLDRLVAVLAAGDLRSAEGLFTDDVEVLDHRSVVGGGADGRSLLREFVDLSAPIDLQYELLAVRSGGLLAARFSMLIEQQEYEWVGVSRENPEGLTDLFIRYDDVDSGLAELERLASSGADPDWMTTFDRMRVAHEHMTAGRVDDWAAMLSDDFVWVEHRQGIRLEAVGRDEARQTLQTILHEPDPEADEPPAPRRADEEPPGLEMTPIDGRGRNLALARVLTYGGGTSRFEREYLLLGRIRDEDGLGNLAMAFDVDDIETATAEIDRLWAQETGDLTPQTDARLSPDNLATAASGVVNAAVRAGSDDLPDLLVDGVDLGSAPHAFGVTERRPVAVRGENLALFEATLGSGDRTWSVEQYDDDGRLLEWRLFDADGLIDAADHLDERSLALTWNMSEWERVGLEYARCHRHLDMDGFRRILTDDFMASDHRSFGFPTVDLEHFLAVPSQIEARGVLLTNDLGHRDGPARLTHSVIYDAKAGEPIERMAGITVFHYRDGRIASAEVFAEDDLAGAMARYEELSSGTVTSSAGRSAGSAASALRRSSSQRSNQSDDEPTQQRVPLNTAARTALRNNQALFGEPDREAWLATFADDVVIEDRQRMAMRTLHGKAEIVGDYGSISQRATQSGFEVETEILGVRDDNLALTFMRVFEADANGRTDTDVFLDHIALYRTDAGGRIDRSAMFDVSDEGDAWDELVRWWAESMSPPERLLALEEVRQGRLFRELRFDEWRASHHPAYTSTDHRPLGFGTADADGMADRNAALTDDVEGGSVRFPVAEMLGSGVRVATIEADLLRKTGAQARIELSYVSIPDLLNGGVRWNHQFALDDFAEARRLGQDVADEHRRTVALTEAVAVGGVASTRARQSPDLFAEMLDADFEATLLDGTVVGHTEVAEGQIDSASLGFGHVERSIVSNDGRVGLFRIDAPDGHAWLSLEIVDDLRLREIHQFPIADLKRAADVFDVRSTDQYPPAIGPLGLRFRQAMNRRDVRELDELIGPDFEVIDRRQLMYGAVDRAGYLQLMTDLGELPAPILTGEVLHASERGWLFRGRQAVPAADGWTENNPGVFVITTSSGRIGRLECFDETDLAVAEARFEELTAASLSPLSNRATDTVALQERLAGEGADEAAFRATFHPDVEVRSFRHLGREGRNDLDALVDDLRTFGKLGYERATVRVLETRGDHLALVNFTSSHRDGWELVVARVYEVDDDGLVTHYASFDRDDLERATAYLEERSREPSAQRAPGTPSTRRSTSPRLDVEVHSFAHRAGLEWSERARAGDAQAILALQVTPDLQVAEQTWGSTLEMGRDGYEQSLETLLSDVQRLDVSYIGHRGPRITAAHLVLHTSSAEVRWVTVAAYEPSGRFSRLEILTSATEAVATMDRWLEEEQRSLDLRNSATMFYEHAGHPFVEVAAVRGDQAAVIETVDGYDFVQINDHGELTIDTFDTYSEAHAWARTTDAIVDPELPLERALAAFKEAASPPDRGRLEAALAANYVHENWNVQDYQPVDRAEAIEFTMAGPGVGIEERQPKRFAQSARAVCLLNRTVSSRAGQTAVDRVIVIGGGDTGITYWGGWPVDMLDEALAKFDELSREPEAQNFSHAALVDWVESARRGDVAAIAERHLSPHLVASESVWGGGFELDSEGFRQNLEALFVDVEELVISYIAHRGPRLLAVHNRLVCGGSERRWVDAFKFDASGRAVRLVTGGSATLAEEQLDRWLEEEQRSPDLRNSATMFYEHAGHAIVDVAALRGDNVAVVETSDGYEFVEVDDHGRLTIERFETYASAYHRARAVTALETDAVDLNPALSRFGQAIQSADRSGPEAALSPRFVRESFGDEPTASTATDIGDVSASIEAALSAGDLDAFAAHFAPDLVFRNESVLSDAGGGKAELLENLASQGEYVWSSEPVFQADQAGVYRIKASLPGDNELEWCLFVTVDDDGLIDRWHVREVQDLRLALIDALPHVVHDAPRGLIGAFAGLNHRDADMLLEGLADGLVMRDHRPFSILGELDREGWVELQVQSMELFPHAAHLLSVVEQRPNLVLGEFIRWSDPSEPADYRFLVLTVAAPDGRLVSFDLYDSDQETEARARFDELDVLPTDPRS